MNAEVQRIIDEALAIQRKHEPSRRIPGLCTCGSHWECDARLMADDTLQRHQDPDLLRLVRELAAPEKLPAAVEGWAVGTRHAGVGSGTPVGGAHAPHARSHPPGA